MARPNILQFLDQGERVIWEGKPNFYPYLLKKSIPSLIIGTPLLLMVLFLNYLVYSTSAYIGFFVTLPMLAFLAFAFFWTPFIILSRKGFPTYYVTSSKRAIILAELGGLDSPFKSYIAIFSKASIRNVLVRQSIFERAFGAKIKTIHFKLGFPVKHEYKVMGSRKGDFENTSLDKTLNGSKMGLSPMVSVMIPKRHTEQETIAFSRGGKYAKEIAFHSVENPEGILAFIQGN